MRAPRGTSVPKTSGQGVSRYSYQQAYKLKPDSAAPKAGGTKRGTSGGLGAHKVRDMADDPFPTGSTTLFRNVLNAYGEKD